MKRILFLLALLLASPVEAAACWPSGITTICIFPVDKTSGGTGISSTATYPSSGVVVTEAASETLTNKTLTSPKINHIVAPGIWNIDFAAVNTDWTFPTSSNDPETVVGATSTQTLQHKTLDSTNTASLDDSLFTIVDHVDNTKAIAWDSAGTASTATTLKAVQTVNRTITFPDATDTLVGQTRSISTTAPITGGGDLSANRTIAITQAATAANGYLSSTDWNTFNSKQATVGVTAPITLTGATVAITQSATAANGYLSSTDWNTFNGKQPLITTLSPANGGTGVANNAASTTTISGNFASTETRTGVTTVTFPTTGTLATLAGSESLTSKTLTSAHVGTSLVFDGTSSGTVTLAPPATIGTPYTVTLPTAQGSANTTLSNNGSGVLTWASILSNPMTTTGDIIYSSDNSGTPSRLAIGASTTVLHGGTTPAYSQIVNADVSASAAIVDTKLATISTAGKVSGTAITSGDISTSGGFSTSNSIASTGSEVSTASSTAGFEVFGGNASAQSVADGATLSYTRPSNNVVLCVVANTSSATAALFLGAFNATQQMIGSSAGGSYTTGTSPGADVIAFAVTTTSINIKNGTGSGGSAKNIKVMCLKL